METIEEQSKCEEMSISPTPSPENLRICLVGSAVDDKATLEAAQTFGVPVITSETGMEIASDSGWTTYFIMSDFEGPAFDAIHKSKHRIMGPPALQQAVEMKDGLTFSTRPVYNYAMRGVVTCFTGIRKKDELTRLVNLIHAMGGSIRKELNTKVTHLICNSSMGAKYQYARIFRLAVVRSAWVFDAWENRDSPDFNAMAEDFTINHKVKIFEGQRICFFGFAPDEHQHMVEVLKSNGGVDTDMEDPDCTHVIMADIGGHYPENILTSRNSSPTQTVVEIDNGEHLVNNEEVTETVIGGDVNENELVIKSSTPPPSSVTEIETIISSQKHEKNPSPSNDKIKINLEDGSTPKSSRMCHNVNKMDGIVLTTNEENEFLNPNNISPILMTTSQRLEDAGNFSRIDEEDENSSSSSDSNGFKKRKRDSFDNMSLLSTDSIAISSAKKPKLIRTGSITRSLKRSMSFVAIRTPIANMLRQRRNSVDPNASLSSITSVESTFNESIKKPVKEKLRGIRDRITKSSKKEINITPKTAKLASSSLGSLKKICKLKKADKQLGTPDNVVGTTIPRDAPTDATDFKTPLVPNFSPTSIINRHSVCGVGSINLNNEDFPHNNTTPVRKSFAADASLSTTSRVVTNTGHDTTTAATTAAVAHNTYMTNECDMSLYHISEHSAVVDKHFVQTQPEPKNDKTHIVKSDWFWTTIQDGYADESLHKFQDYLNSIANTPCADRRDSHPCFNKRKRKRFSQLLQIEGTPTGSGKRRSSVSDAGLLSISGSFLECTTSPEKHDVGKLIVESEAVIDTAPKNKSMRYNHFMDFYNTESNYVGILDTIVQLFKIPLEEKAESESDDALLNKCQVGTIFNNFLPIHEVHQQMLERLKELKMKWHEDYLIGQIILDHRDELIKAYPPYVNFFEKMKETLIQCDIQNPRFHAFLKINQAKPECGRQTLQDLMIRPVQRLPSISLLLNDILKHTNKNNPDYKKLEEALKAIREVMAHINEDKRKTEGQLAMFDIFNDIEGCPAHLVSSHRSFVSKCEVTELSESLSGRGDSLILYLFSDTIEVCKKRSRGFNSAKSPSTTKSFKHVKLMPLSTIRFVIDISDSKRAFALNCRHSQDNKDRLYSFVICDEEIDKFCYLRSLCKQMADNACRTDAEKPLVTMTSQDLDVDISDITLSGLSKAFKFATRTRLKVSRAFSFNKTPSKLKRAVSTMMTSPFGSTNSLTPASQLAQMKLASCTNINEVGEEEDNRRESPSSQSEVLLVAPMSVQPTRKAKSSTISMAALRRL